MFATHYHELTELATQLARVSNVQVLVREEGHNIAFLHRAADGAAASSYGIHVAGLAGLPEPVIRRAREVLAGLEAAARRPLPGRMRRGPSRSQQLALPLPSQVEESLRRADLARMTPLEALNFLSTLKALVEAGSAPAEEPDLTRRASGSGGALIPFPVPPVPPKRE